MRDLPTHSSPAARGAARLAAVELRVHNVRARDPQAFRGALAAISRERAGALPVLPDAGFHLPRRAPNHEAARTPQTESPHLAGRRDNAYVAAAAAWGATHGAA